MSIIKMTDKPLRARPASDWYPTSYETALGTLYMLQELLGVGLVDSLRILDPGAGNGVWGRAARELWPDAFIVGIELDTQHTPDPAYNMWSPTDFLLYEQDGGFFDLVIGNPPYSLAEQFIRNSLEVMERGGDLFFLLRLEFLASQRRAYGLFHEHQPLNAFVMSKRPSFTGDGKTNAMDFMMLHFEKRATVGEEGSTSVCWYNFETSYNHYMKSKTEEGSVMQEFIGITTPGEVLQQVGAGYPGVHTWSEI